MLHLTDWAKYLLESNSWHLSLGFVDPIEFRGKRIWEAWWENYRAIDPNHIILIWKLGVRLAFQGRLLWYVMVTRDAADGDKLFWLSLLSRCWVVGRTQLIKAAKGKGVKKPYIKHETNLVGHTLTTHFLAGCATTKQVW